MDSAFLLRKFKKTSRFKMEVAKVQDFNVEQFEKRLSTLKDSQESINNCCHWCLENRAHHKKIVSSWLNVLKRVKMEHRLVLFYLANDVIQYSKRRNYEFVESWGTTLQKATTMVRDERIKHKILRIFKIWEQRGIYSEEFLTDLSGLISATTAARKPDDPHEFQSSYLITKIRNCSKLESDTDAKLKVLKDHNPKIQFDNAETLCASLKDRAHLDDVEREIDDYVHHMEAYVNALKLEIKSRSNLISLLTQADTQLESDRKDVKLVANAYRTFGTRIKNVKKKLDELLPTLVSPIPSPDIDAPSPSPDSDIELPVTDTNTKNMNTITTNGDPSGIHFQNPGYYNPLQTTTSENSGSFLNNGFTSFIGSNMPFNVGNLNASDIFSSNTTQASLTNTTQTTNTFNLSDSISSLFSSITQPPPPPEAVPPPVDGSYQAPPFLSSTVGVPPVAGVPQGVPPPTTGSYRFSSTHMPLLPPPMPPFSKDSAYGNGTGYTDVYSSSNAGNYDPTFSSSSAAPSYQDPSYQPSVDTCFPLSIDAPYDQIETNPYDPDDNSWIQPAVDTPESPPMFEKEAFGGPQIEYHDNVDHGSGAADVDHRVLLRMPSPPVKNSIRGKDIDHRNLISLTGSPAENTPPAELPEWESRSDQDYRNPPPPITTPTPTDQDYRVPINIEQLKLPPPPPPPPKSKSPKKPGMSPRKMQDNVESIDMDLSDDELQTAADLNLKVIVDPSREQSTSDNMLEPPPPFPDLPEDVDANNFLDDLDNELNSGDFTLEDQQMGQWGFGTDGPPPVMGHPSGMMHPPPMGPPPVMGAPPPPNMGQPPPNMWMNPHHHHHQDGGFRGGRGNKRGNNFNARGNRGGGDFGMRGRGGGMRPPFRGGPFRGAPKNRNMRGNFRGRGGRGNFRGNFGF